MSMLDTTLSSPLAAQSTAAVASSTLEQRVAGANVSADVRPVELAEGQGMPAVLSPNRPGIALDVWLAASKTTVVDHLHRAGAVLFRGFDVGSIAEFERAAATLCSPLFGEYGDLPKEKNGDAVYHSTPYPADKHILFHNEASHTARWPMKQWFYCMQPSREGGETPLVDCRRIFAQLDPALRDAFSSKRLRYVRTFVEGLDVSWEDFFKTSDRNAVERTCSEAGVQTEWLANGWLRVSQICPAVLEHPYTREKVFFNQIQLHHSASLDPELRASILDLFGEEACPRNVLYGDGTPIPDSVVEEITHLYWRNAVAFPWQQGDIVLVDNMLVAHARNPFVGPRKIVVAMGDMVSRNQFSF